VDVRFAGDSPAQAELSAEQVAAMLGMVAAGGFEAIIKAQKILLTQLLSALAAREELLGRVSTGALPVRVSTGALPAELAPRRPVGPT
jgi:hypothetical protein